MNVSCKLGEPQLKYHNGVFEVNETLSNSDDVWLGYIYAKVPFLLLGCASLQGENGVHVHAVADCYKICGGGQLEIKRTSNGTVCICVSGSFDTNQPICKGGDRNSICNNCSEIYTQINDLTARAIVEKVHSYDWSTGNRLCLTIGRHPSFERSITNAGFWAIHTQYYWTGIFRANILIQLSLKETTLGSTRSLSTTQIHTTLTTDYAFPTSDDGILTESRHTNSEKLPALGLRIGVSKSVTVLEA
ncbi:uncharacterized protein LOC127860319 [Dreissena polymorpha]|uniref:uncharacterized protein LOC127860319 n=1 Tax=Dreissena polymorpha TaxID=45954 RepID=UPI002264051A|nr:uncharacterized protein LOC127860319 [Dreissena polymorpha]